MIILLTLLTVHTSEVHKLIDQKYITAILESIVKYLQIAVLP